MSVHTFRLVFGDWSDDGHKQSEEFVIQSNRTVAECQEAYRASCKLTGFQLHGSGDDNFTGLEYTYENEEDYELCNNYEKARPSQRIIDIMTEHKYPKAGQLSTEEGIYIDELKDILLWFIGLSLPGFEWKIVPPTKIPTFNGYFGPLNISIGYACYE